MEPSLAEPYVAKLCRTVSFAVCAEASIQGSARVINRMIATIIILIFLSPFLRLVAAGAKFLTGRGIYPGLAIGVEWGWPPRMRWSAVRQHCR